MNSDDEQGREFQELSDRLDRADTNALARLCGRFPPWLAQDMILRCTQALHTLLDAGQTVASICESIKQDRANEDFLIPGTARDGLAYMLAVNWLAHVQYALEHDDVEAAEILGGPDARRGRKIMRSAQMGHVSTYGTPNERRCKYAQWQARINELHRRNPRRSHSALCKQLGDELGASARTIKRHTRL